jgi:hypothetical protein
MRQWRQWTKCKTEQPKNAPVNNVGICPLQQGLPQTILVALHNQLKHGMHRRSRLDNWRQSRAKRMRRIEFGVQQLHARRVFRPLRTVRLYPLCDIRPG